MTQSARVGVGWIPASEDDLRTAARAGTLDETTTRLEFKQQVTWTDSGRRTLAEELASLAVDGGSLIEGIVDVRHRANPNDPDAALSPVDLAGRAERIEQIALSRCDPPLYVRVITIPSAADPTRGYLVVHVPPSASAPHMVAGRYWGRGDTTKRSLTDAEVTRLHERRKSLERDASAVLADYVSRDPWIASGQEQHHAHLFVVAEPVAARPEMLLSAGGDGPGWQQWLIRLIQNRANENPRFGSIFAPDLNYTSNAERRANGWAATSLDLIGGEVAARADESDLLEVELTFDGAVRLFCGRGSDTLQNGGKLAFEQLIAGLTYRSVCLSADISRMTDYPGAWAFGIAVTGLASARSWLQYADHRSGGRAVNDKDLRHFIRASSFELEDKPREVNGRLAGRVIRLLGTERSSKLEPFMTLS